MRITRFSPRALWQFFKYNTFAEIKRGDVIIPTPNCVIRVAKNAKINKHGKTILGHRAQFPKSQLETRLLVGDGATLNFGSNVLISYGADIEIFSGATLSFGDDVFANIGLTVICGENIEFGNGATAGRQVSVRDTNGGHYINTPNYENTSPVVIGNKTWLCDSCAIMNGVNIGDGAIIGARAVVIHDVPSHCIVHGHPAKVVRENVLWKR